MIDNKKIEDAAKIYMIGEFYDRDKAEWNYPITHEEKRNLCIIDFKAGAYWKINEFLKDLWHPASEEPKKGRVFLYKTMFEGYGINQIIDGNEWKYIIKYQKATQWLYIDDLLPKKGGKHG